MKAFEKNDIQKTKCALVNTILTVVSVVGFPVLFVSVFRSLKIDNYRLIIAHSVVYAVALVTSILRNKLCYRSKTLIIVLFAFALAIIDLANNGYASSSSLWLLTAIIITALFYNVQSSIIASVFAAFIFAVFFFLYQTGLVRYDISDVSNSYIGINISLRYMIILLSGLMIAFGINHIQKQLLNSIDSLTDQKKHLKRVAKKLRKEIKIRKKSEALAIQNEKNFRNIFETSSDAILIINTERKIVDFNPAFLSLSKYPENQ